MTKLKRGAQKAIPIIITLLVAVFIVHYENALFPKNTENNEITITDSANNKIILADSVEIQELNNSESYLNDLDKDKDKNGKEAALLAELEKAFGFYMSGLYEEALAIFEDKLNKVHAEDNPKIYGKIRTHEAGCHIGLAKKGDAVFHMQSARFSIDEARKVLTIEEYPLERASLSLVLADFNKQLKETSYNLETVVLAYEGSVKLFKEHGSQVQHKVALNYLAKAYEKLAKRIFLEKEQNGVAADMDKEKAIEMFIKAIGTRNLYLSTHSEEDDVFVGMHMFIASDCDYIVRLQEDNDLSKEYVEQCIFSLEEILRVYKIITPEDETLYQLIEQDLEKMKALNALI